MSREILNVVGYPRVSTDDQARHGASLADQVELIREHAAARGLNLVEMIADEGASSKSLERPGLRRILAMLADGRASGIVVTHLDRLTRHVGDMVRLVEEYFGDDRGLRIFSLGQPVDTRTASGRMLIYIQIVVSQYQRESTVERTVETFARKKDRGERLGTVPYGSRLGADGKTLEPEPAEVEALAVMDGLRLSGWTARAIASEMDRLGYPTRSGRPWAHSTVAKLLRAGRRAADAGHSHGG